jgi:DNA-binding Lrp family transcriptional regulator
MKEHSGNLDPIDKKILFLLQQDAKMTMKELAAQLDLTSTPVFERVKRLEREGFIEGYRAILNREKLGKRTTVFCTVSLKEHAREHLLHFETEIAKLDAVVACYHIAGLFDYLMEIAVEDMDAYEHFIRNQLATIPYVGKVQSSFVMTRVKKGTGTPV